MAEMLSEALHIRNVSMVLFSVEAMHNGERVPRLTMLTSGPLLLARNFEK